METLIIIVAVLIAISLLFYLAELTIDFGSKLLYFLFKTIASFLLVQLASTVLIYPSLKYVHSSQYFILDIAGAILLITFILLVPIKKSKQDIINFHNESNTKKEVSSRAKYFFFHVINILSILFLIESVIANILYPIFNNYLGSLLSEQVFISGIIVFAGLIILYLIEYYKSYSGEAVPFKKIGSYIVSLNCMAIIIATFLLYKPCIQFLSNLFGASFYSHELLIFYLISIYFHTVNISAFLSYGYDKNAAENDINRIPEIILHWHSVCGGTIGAYFGHHFFVHKMYTEDSRAKFSPIFNSIAITQAILVFLLSSLSLSMTNIYLPRMETSAGLCPNGSRQFVAGETKDFNVYICGKNKPNQYVGISKSDKNEAINLNLTSFSNDKYVAKNGRSIYIVTRNNLKVTEDGRVVVNQSLRVSNWNNYQ